MSFTGIDESTLFIASCPASLDDFLKTPIAAHKHIYCSYSLSWLDYGLRKQLNKQGVESISFQDSPTLYPPFDKQ